MKTRFPLMFLCLAHLDFDVSLEDRKIPYPLIVIIITISNLLLGIPSWTLCQLFKLHLSKTKLNYVPCKLAPSLVSSSLIIM